MRCEMDIPQYLDCTRMARLMRISRSRLYQLIDDDVVLQPAYLIANRRPVYTREMAVRNLMVKEQNVGINGRVVMFYASRRVDPVAHKPKPAPIKKVQENKKKPQAEKHSELVEAMEALGIENVTAEQVDSAIRKCFPDGTADIGEDNILRAVFRHLKRQNYEHKPRT